MFLPSSTLPKTTTCLPATQCRQCRRKTGKCLCWGPAFALDKMPGPTSLCRNSHHQISLHRCTHCQCHYGHEVTTPAHQSLNCPVKAGNFITTSFLPSAQSPKVVCQQLKGDRAQRLTLTSDVKEHHGGVGRGWLAWVARSSNGVSNVCFELKHSLNYSYLTYQYNFTTNFINLKF